MTVSTPGAGRREPSIPDTPPNSRPPSRVPDRGRRHRQQHGRALAIGVGETVNKYGRQEAARFRRRRPEQFAAIAETHRQHASSEVVVR